MNKTAEDVHNSYESDEDEGISDYQEKWLYILTILMRVVNKT